MAVVKDSFLSDTTWSIATAMNRSQGDPGWDISVANPPLNYTDVILGMQRDALNEDEYTYMNVSACFDFYDDYFTPQGNVLIFVKNESIQHAPTDSLLLFVGIVPRSDDWAKNMWALENGTVGWVLKSPSRTVNTWYLGKPHYEVDHCLVQKPALSQRICRFEYSSYIIWAICSVNLIKAIVSK